MTNPNLSPTNPQLPKLESAGDALLRLAPAIGQGLSNIIQPNAERNELLKNFLAANPDQIDVFIDAAQSNPEQFKELFGKDSTSRFALMELSPKFANEKKAAERLAEATANLSTQEVEDQARVAAEIGTEAERRTQTSEATIRAQAARLAPGLAREELLALADRLKSRDKGREELDALRVKIGAITIEKLLKNNRIDTLSDDALLQLSPGIRDEVFSRLAFDKKIRLARVEASQTGDTSLFNRVADPLIDAATRLGVNPVALLMGKLGMTAQEVFQAFPQVRGAAQSAALDPQAVQEAVTAFDSEVQSKVLDEIITTIAQADEGSFATKAAAALKVNTLLREIGITGITARMDDRGIIIKKALQFFDRDDNLIAAEDVTAMIADQLGLNKETISKPQEVLETVAASSATEEQLKNDPDLNDADREEITRIRANQ